MNNFFKININILNENLAKFARKYFQQEFHDEKIKEFGERVISPIEKKGRILNENAKTLNQAINKLEEECGSSF